MTGFAQDANGRDSFVIIGAFILLLIRLEHHLSGQFARLYLAEDHPVAATRGTADSGSRLPRCHMRTASRRMLATTAIFFFLGFLVLIRS